MGWSCTQEAGRTMERIYNLHGDDALYHYRGKEYFFDASSREYEDGHISMSAFVCVSGGKCRKVATFKIFPGGEIKKNVLGIKDKI